MPDDYRALVLRETSSGIAADIERVRPSAPAPGETLVRVCYSSLNYKDGLFITGRRRAAQYPLIPGIDLAGVVEGSIDGLVAKGSEVILTGHGLGEIRSGGYSTHCLVPDDWLLPMPQSLTMARSMAIGTAGLTAMLAVMALEDRGLESEAGPVAVTGATGGVGSFAIALLAQQGIEVIAVTGRAASEAKYLTSIGATHVIDRQDFVETPIPVLGGAIDGIGGEALQAILRRLGRERAVVALGRAAGNDVSLTLEPFVLRGVAIIGLDSVYCEPERRRTAWRRLAQELSPSIIDRLTRIASLDAVPELAQQIMAGALRGRTVIHLNPLDR